MKISIIGLGVVGQAMYDSFIIKTKNNSKYNIYGYDKYKNGGIGTLESCVDSDIIMTALPTLYKDELNNYDYSSTYEVIEQLNNMEYKKFVLIKSTVEPLFTEKIAEKYPNITFIHNPEFLYAKTAFEDFHNQKYIILGTTPNYDNYNLNTIRNMYIELYCDNIKICTSNESECVKLFYNTYCSVKIQYFNELYLLSNKIGCDFEYIKDMMYLTGSIEKNHTQVPGPDGKLSFGGMCLPKDCKALLAFMKNNNINCDVLDACVNEMTLMRKDINA
jgi:nucleotide sugar dehydrogenase